MLFFKILFIYKYVKIILFLNFKIYSISKQNTKKYNLKYKKLNNKKELNKFKLTNY